MTRLVMFECKEGRHLNCPGHQIRFHSDHNEQLICSCGCGHKAAIKGIRGGYRLPPRGWGADEFIEQIKGTTEGRPVLEVPSDAFGVEAPGPGPEPRQTKPRRRKT